MANGTDKLLLGTQQEKPNHYTYLKEFRVEQCQSFLQHKCNQHRPFICFNWHFQNQRRRRPVRKRDGTFNYSADNYCTKYDETTGICPDGDDCVFLHRTAGDTERRYHLRYYKTCMCVHDTDSRGYCVKNGHHCAFAHGLQDQRPPVYDIKELETLQNAEIALDGTNAQNALDKERNLMNEDPKWQDTNYVLANYKTEPCKRPPRLCRQGYACPQFHNSKDKRRSPRKFKYRSTPCPNVKHGEEWGEPGNCEAGDNCQYCHTRTEQQFHPEIYKSTKCNDVQQAGYCPRSVFCAFAHVEPFMISEDICELDGMPTSLTLSDLISSALPDIKSKDSNHKPGLIAIGDNPSFQAYQAIENILDCEQGFLDSRVPLLPVAMPSPKPLALSYAAVASANISTVEDGPYNNGNSVKNNEEVFSFSTYADAVFSNIDETTQAEVQNTHGVFCKGATFVPTYAAVLSSNYADERRVGGVDIEELQGECADITAYDDTERMNEEFIEGNFENQNQELGGAYANAAGAQYGFPEENFYGHYTEPYRAQPWPEEYATPDYQVGNIAPDFTEKYSHTDFAEAYGARGNAAENICAAQYTRQSSTAAYSVQQNDFQNIGQEFPRPCAAQKYAPEDIAGPFTTQFGGLNCTERYFDQNLLPAYAVENNQHEYAEECTKQESKSKEQGGGVHITGITQGDENKPVVIAPQPAVQTYASVAAKKSEIISEEISKPAVKTYASVLCSHNLQRKVEQNQSADEKPQSPDRPLVQHSSTATSSQNGALGQHKTKKQTPKIMSYAAVLSSESPEQLMSSVSKTKCLPNSPQFFNQKPKIKNKPKQILYENAADNLRWDEDDERKRNSADPDTKCPLVNTANNAQYNQDRNTTGFASNNPLEAMGPNSAKRNPPGFASNNPLEAMGLDSAKRTPPGFASNNPLEAMAPYSAKRTPPGFASNNPLEAMAPYSAKRTPPGFASNNPLEAMGPDSAKSNPPGFASNNPLEAKHPDSAKSIPFIKPTCVSGNNSHESMPQQSLESNNTWQKNSTHKNGNTVYAPISSYNRQINTTRDATAYISARNLTRHSDHAAHEAMVPYNQEKYPTLLPTNANREDLAPYNPHNVHRSPTRYPEPYNRANMTPTRFTGNTSYKVMSSYARENTTHEAMSTYNQEINTTRLTAYTSVQAIASYGGEANQTDFATNTTRQTLSSYSWERKSSDFTANSYRVAKPPYMPAQNQNCLSESSAYGYMPQYNSARQQMGFRTHNAQVAMASYTQKASYANTNPEILTPYSANRISIHLENNRSNAFKGYRPPGYNSGRNIPLGTTARDCFIRNVPPEPLVSNGHMMHYSSMKSYVTQRFVPAAVPPQLIRFPRTTYAAPKRRSPFTISNWRARDVACSMDDPRENSLTANLANTNLITRSSAPINIPNSSLNNSINEFNSGGFAVNIPSSSLTYSPTNHSNLFNVSDTYNYSNANSNKLSNSLSATQNDSNNLFFPSRIISPGYNDALSISPSVRISELNSIRDDINSSSVGNSLFENSLVTNKNAFSLQSLQNQGSGEVGRMTTELMTKNSQIMKLSNRIEDVLLKLNLAEMQREQANKEALEWKQRFELSQTQLNLTAELRSLSIQKLKQLQSKLRGDLEEVEKVLYLENAKKCMKCEENNRTVTLEPCNHFILCDSCACSVTECPYCQIPIPGVNLSLS